MHSLERQRFLLFAKLPMKKFAVCFLAVVPPMLSPATDSPRLSLPQAALKAMERATDSMQSISTGGGYVWNYTLDLSERAGTPISKSRKKWPLRNRTFQIRESADFAD